jgi:hypothetical protein
VNVKVTQNANSVETVLTLTLKFFGLRKDSNAVFRLITTTGTLLPNTENVTKFYSFQPSLRVLVSFELDTLYIIIAHSIILDSRISIE